MNLGTVIALIKALGGGSGGGGGGSILVVNATFEDEWDLVLDKTFAEIRTAYLSGEKVVVKIITDVNAVLVSDVISIDWDEGEEICKVITAQRWNGVFPLQYEASSVNDYPTAALD